MSIYKVSAGITPEDRLKTAADITGVVDGYSEHPNGVDYRFSNAQPPNTVFSVEGPHIIVEDDARPLLVTPLWTLNPASPARQQIFQHSIDRNLTNAEADKESAVCAGRCPALLLDFLAA